MNTTKLPASKASPLEKPKPKSSSKKPDTAFKVITPAAKCEKKAFCHQISPPQDLTIKDLSARFNLKNDSSSTTTHSSNNIPSKPKPEHQTSKIRLQNPHSYSPLNYQDLKLDKESYLPPSTPGKIKSNLSVKKRSPFTYLPPNEKKFEDLCQDDVSFLKTQDKTIEELRRENKRLKLLQQDKKNSRIETVDCQEDNGQIKAQEKMIEELRRENKRLKQLEKKAYARIETLERENQEMKSQLLSKSFFDRFMRSATTNNTANSNRPVMIDEGCQVFIGEEEEFQDLEAKVFLMNHLANLEEKLENIEKNAVKCLKIKEERRETLECDNEERNRLKELENTVKELFIKNRNLEGMMSEIKNERDVLGKVVEEKKCNSCLKEEEEIGKNMVPIPGYLKLLRMGFKGKK